MIDTLFSALFLRNIGIVAYLPTPKTIKATIAFTIALLEYGMVASQRPTSIVAQLIVGLTVGSIVLVIREIGNYLGSIIDNVRGLNIGSFLNPLSKSSQSPSSSLLTEIVWMYFVVGVGFPFIALLSIASLDLVPLEVNSLSSFFNVQRNISQAVYLLLVECNGYLLLAMVLLILADLAWTFVVAVWNIPNIASDLAFVLRSVILIGCVWAGIRLNGPGIIDGILSVFAEFALSDQSALAFGSL